MSANRGHREKIREASDNNEQTTTKVEYPIFTNIASMSKNG